MTELALSDPMAPAIFQVDEIHPENNDTFTIELRSREDGNRPFPFMPGQFNMIYIYGVGEVPISISGDPINNQTLKHTTRVVGTVTKAIGSLQKGDTIGIRGPYGTWWPMDAARGKDVVLVVGGIGLAPIRPAVYYLLKNREAFRQIVLLYGTRDPSDILFKNELKEWGRQGLQVFITVDRANKDWRGNVGVVTTLIPRAPFDPLGAVAFVCGPEVMMYFSINSLQQRGMRDEDIFLSMERNMKCGVGLCGHCQFGPHFLCKDGPVFNFTDVVPFFRKAEV
ncbi:MAG: FAD/NAD(P)-binding protein [Candidatus Omnitrophota bacterium]|nr:FAD/NAD(P)-binding protein [Candidatus Omnitrophota bacterium]MDZ4242844.1 FAD/NAD(P)-binding protein [Candidatus Omnitrophota bacterium]